MPLVQTSTAGCLVAWPWPTAAKAAERSSWNTWVATSGREASANANGVEREPGATNAVVTPCWTHWSISVAQNVAVAVTGAECCIRTRYGHPWRVSLYSETIGSGPRVVLVHGFTQNGRCWNPIADWLADDHEVVLIDAPGHGFSSHDDASLAEAGELLLEAGGTGTYVGYSMGARMLLHAALGDAASDGPAQIERLVVIGATGGLDTAAERAERIAADEVLAASLESDGLRPFLDRWLAMPLFAALSEEAAGKEFRLGNRSAGLAASLRACGTGTQEPLWEQLSAITIPVSVVVGSDDTKFEPLAERLAESIGDNAVIDEVDGGHAVHLESPDLVTPILESSYRFEDYEDLGEDDTVDETVSGPDEADDV